MRFHANKIILKYHQCVQEFFFKEAEQNLIFINTHIHVDKALIINECLIIDKGLYSCNNTLQVGKEYGCFYELTVQAIFMTFTYPALNLLNMYLHFC